MHEPTCRDLPSDKIAFWQSRYKENHTPWDLGTVAPPLVTLYQEQLSHFNLGKMLVVGCGHGHDAAFFGQMGVDVTGIDFVSEAIEAATKDYGQWARFLQADLFDLPPSFLGQFDTVLEHTCFCAIPPQRREDYVQAVSTLLKPKGTFIGLFWAFVDEDGPPYPSTPEEIERLFSPYFTIESLILPKDSVAERRNQELLGVFTPKFCE